MALARKAATAFARLIVITLGLGCCAIAVFLVAVVWPNFWASLLLGVLALVVFAGGVFAVFRGVWGAAEDSESMAQDFIWELVFRILFEGLLGG